MNNSISSYENTLIIDGHKLPAVQSVDMSYEVPQESLRILGVGHAKNAISAPPRGNLSLNRIMTHKDPLDKFMDGSATNGSIHWQGASFGMKNLYLNSYGASFSVDSMPTVNVSMTSYDMDVGGGFQETVSEPDLEIQPISRGQIEVQCNGYETNRVTDCSFELRLSRDIVYTFSENEPFDIVNISPKEVDFSFTVEIDDYEHSKILNHLLQQDEQDVSIKIRNLSGFNYTQVDSSPYSASWSGRISVIPSGLKGANLFRTGELIRFQNPTTKEYIDREVNSIVEGTYANIIEFTEPLTQDFIVDETSDANYGKVKVHPYIFNQEVSSALLQGENISAGVGAENSINLQYKGYINI
jgi:hypothetical protein